jgi:hypothetical protein
MFLTHRCYFSANTRIYKRRGAGGRDSAVHVRLQDSGFRFVVKSEITIYNRIAPTISSGNFTDIIMKNFVLMSKSCKTTDTKTGSSNLRSSWIIVDYWLVTSASVKPIGPSFKSRAIQRCITSQKSENLIHTVA